MATIHTYVGSPGAIGGASGGKFYAFNNLSTTPAVVLAANASRQSVTFHNPGPTIVIYVAPSLVLVSGSNATLTPSTTTLGGCFAIAAGASITISGECQGAWQAFSASSSSLPLTVMETNI
jgi:hypothetical protein